MEFTFYNIDNITPIKIKISLYMHLEFLQLSIFLILSIMLILFGPCQRLRVLENRVLRRVFGSKSNKVTGGCRNCITRSFTA
jgi:hypothetical protein